jgi:predicted adenylyl cyclase CyaB
MARNLEIKVKFSSHTSIKEILTNNGIIGSEFIHQKDIYYKVDRGILKLRIENEKQTLIYYDRNEKSKKRWSDYYLLNITTQDADIFFKRLLDEIVTVEKQRELFLYKNTRIHLDKVKGLGYFIELETRVINGLKDAEKRFTYLVDLLNLRSKTEIRASYKDLLLQKKLLKK